MNLADPSYKKLIAWEKSDLLARQVYKVTLKFPKTEIYGSTSQLRRAALSVVLNIIEGHGRQNKKEFYHFLRIAYASLVETEYLLSFTKDQGYMTEKEFEQLEEARLSCGQVLWRLLKSQS